MENQKHFNLSLFLTIILMTGLGIGSFAQENQESKKKVIELVSEDNGVEKRATATFENGEWKYEGDAEMIEKIKTQMSSQGDDHQFYFEAGEEGQTKIIKKQVHTGTDGEHDINIEVIVDEEEGKHNMIFVNEDGNVTHIDMVGGESGNVWVHDGDSDPSVIVMTGENGEIDQEKVEKLKSMVDEGASKEEIMNELGMDDNGENVFLSIDKTIEVEVENGVKAGSETVVVVIKKFELKEVEESELPKSMKQGFSIQEKGLLSDISFYPNPNNGEFNLRGQVNKDLPVEVLITDMDGREVLSERIAGHGGSIDYKIDIREKSTGMYLVRLSQNGEGVVKKIVVN